MNPMRSAHAIDNGLKRRMERVRERVNGNGDEDEVGVGVGVWEKGE